MDKSQFDSSFITDEDSIVRHNKSNPVEFPAIVRNIMREDKVVTSNEEIFIHLCCNDSTKPLVNKLTAGRLVVDKKAVQSVISPDLFIEEDSYRFLTLYNRFQRYGLEAIFDITDVPNIVLEAFDVINNTIDSEQAKVYMNQKKQAEEAQKEQTKSKRKSLPKT